MLRAVNVWKFTRSLSAIVLVECALCTGTVDTKEVWNGEPGVHHTCVMEAQT